MALILVLGGCEEPTRKAQEAALPAADEKAQAAVKSPESPEKKPEAEEKEEPVEYKEGYPYFHIYRDGEALVVDGALKSGGQVKQIVGELEEYFAKLEIKSGLRKDPRRHAVGWGNRISDAVLFDYFTLVSDPEIEYKEGVVTLKGSVADERKHRLITEMVIAGFMDVWTNDIANEIKVGE
ncbi:MAG: hypothetical protein P1U86_12585 [Verrucomicrobiales bacterium]|nr:hypothetical protein [Verrucomicrobiales bacterium]